MLVSSAYLSRWPWLPSDLHQKICMHQVLDKPASMPIIQGCVHGKDTTPCSPASSLGCLSQLTHEKAHPQLLVRVTVGTANCFQFLNLFFFPPQEHNTSWERNHATLSSTQHTPPSIQVYIIPLFLYLTQPIWTVFVLSCHT